MEVASMEKLRQYMISSAIQRCRKADYLCRLSVVLRSSPSSERSLVRISVSDTGIGSCLEEFQDLKYMADPASAEKWDGMISVTTTSIRDNEINHYLFNHKEILSTRRMTKLTSTPKNGATFSGTEVSISSFGSIDDFLAEVTHFLRKILILKIPNVAVDVVVKRGIPGSQSENFILSNERIPSQSLSSNIERLKLGFEYYVLKHGKSWNVCRSCFPSGEHLKVGSGVACYPESHTSNGQVMEAVIIISEVLESSIPLCFSARDTKTEVLYFMDFAPCSISQSSLDALISVNWKSYGLAVKSVAEKDGCALLEWEGIPSYLRIDVALHCYHRQVLIAPAARRTQPDRALTRKALRSALNDLKEKNKGVFLSKHAVKICSYVPDLARTIAGLVLSSNDLDFQQECCSVLGLPFQEIEEKNVQECIKERIISVIEMDDRKPKRIREDTTFLFQDDCFQEPEFLDEDYEEGFLQALEWERVSRPPKLLMTWCSTVIQANIRCPADYFGVPIQGLKVHSVGCGAYARGALRSWMIS